MSSATETEPAPSGGFTAGRVRGVLEAVGAAIDAATSALDGQSNTVEQEHDRDELSLSERPKTAAVKRPGDELYRSECHGASLLSENIDGKERATCEECGAVAGSSASILFG